MRYKIKSNVDTKQSYLLTSDLMPIANNLQIKNLPSRWILYHRI